MVFNSFKNDHDTFLQQQQQMIIQNEWVCWAQCSKLIRWSMFFSKYQQSIKWCHPTKQNITDSHQRFDFLLHSGEVKFWNYHLRLWSWGHFFSPPFCECGSQMPLIKLNKLPPPPYYHSLFPLSPLHKCPKLRSILIISNLLTSIWLYWHFKAMMVSLFILSVEPFIERKFLL